MEEKEGKEGGLRGGGGGVEGQTSIFQSPLRLVRKAKMKLVVCQVALLDGTDFTCEVEVRHVCVMYTPIITKECGQKDVLKLYCYTELCSLFLSICLEEKNQIPLMLFCPDHMGSNQWVTCFPGF